MPYLMKLSSIAITDLVTRIHTHGSHGLRPQFFNNVIPFLVIIMEQRLHIEIKEENGAPPAPPPPNNPAAESSINGFLKSIADTLKSMLTIIAFLVALYGAYEFLIKDSVDREARKYLLYLLAGPAADTGPTEKEADVVPIDSRWLERENLVRLLHSTQRTDRERARSISNIQKQTDTAFYFNLSRIIDIRDSSETGKSDPIVIRMHTNQRAYVTRNQSYHINIFFNRWRDDPTDLAPSRPIRYSNADHFLKIGSERIPFKDGDRSPAQDVTCIVRQHIHQTGDERIAIGIDVEEANDENYEYDFDIVLVSSKLQRDGC